MLPQQKLLRYYLFLLCGSVFYLLFKLSSGLSSGVNAVNSKQADYCKYPSLRYEILSSSVVGDVISDSMTLFVLVVDDSTQQLSPEYIIRNGVIQGRYLKGSKWEVSVEHFSTFPGSLYIVGTYANNECYTQPVLINLPLTRYILGPSIILDAAYMLQDDKHIIVMRGNSIMETQYYLMYTVSDSYISESEFYQDENYLELGKNGMFVTANVDDVIGKYNYAYIGCSVEDFKSKIIQIDLNMPIDEAPKSGTFDTNYVISATAKDRPYPAEVNPEKNSGNLDSDKTWSGASGGKSPIRVRTVQTFQEVVFVRCILVGGPYDIYYLVRPESKERGVPDERTVMRYGQKAGNFDDTSFDIVITDYVMSMKNMVYIVAVKGKTILGPTTRGFIP